MASSPTPNHDVYEEEEVGKGHGCHSIIPSLPKEKGWRSIHIYQYQGFWYRFQELQAIMAFQKHFQARDSDLILVTTPKSGSIWLKALAFAIINRRRFTGSEHPLIANNPHDLVPFFEFRLYVQDQLPDLSSLPSPRLFATHTPYESLPASIKDSDCRIVYLCRNPKDSFVSYWHFINKLKPKNLPTLSLEEAFDMFCRGVFEFGPFWDHVLGYWKESLERPQKVLFLKYEDMKEDISFHLKRLAEFMGHPFSLEEEEAGVVEEISRLCSFENMSNLGVNRNGETVNKLENRIFFRRGEVGDWKNYFTPSMVKNLDMIMEEKLQFSSLKFSYNPR